jgi:hypothetical protein
MLISTNITSIRLIKRTKDTDGAKDKAHTENIVQGIHTTEENTREIIKKIKYFNRKSTMSVISYSRLLVNKTYYKERQKAYQKFRQQASYTTEQNVIT